MVLRISHLKKTFLTGFTQTKRKTVLEDVSFTIRAGEIYGFLGINGSGKTTTLETIMGFLNADSGSISFFKNQRLNNEVRKKIGYAQDKTPYFEFLTGWENVMVLGKYADIAKQQREKSAEVLFKKLGLSYAKDYYVQNYSQGMKQRLGLILSLINDPDLLFRDEPMSGLDPLGRIIVKDLMKDLQQQGKTIIFSTHILSDVQEIADRFGILAGGKIIYEGDTKDVHEDLELFFREKVAEVKSLEKLEIQ